MRSFRGWGLTVFLFTTFSGTLRKWLSSDGFFGNCIFAVQLLLPLAGALLVARQARHGHTRLQPFVSYLFILLLAACNPLNTTLIHALTGVCIHIAFWTHLLALSSCRYKPGRVFDVVMLASCVIETIVATYQYYAPPDALLNRYASATDGQDGLPAMVGESIRPTGTFSYVAGFGAFAVYTSFLTCHYLQRGAVAASLAASSLGFYLCLLSGSRASLIAFVIVLALFIAFELKPDRRPVLVKIFLVVSMCIGTNVALNDPLRLTKALSYIVANFSDRFSSGRPEFEHRLVNDVADAGLRDFPYQATGIGLGATYQGANGLAGKSPFLESVFFEGELFRVVIEGGWGLLIGRFVLLAIILSRLKFSPGFGVGIFVLVGCFSPIVFNVYTSVYLACGLALLAGNVETQSRAT